MTDIKYKKSRFFKKKAARRATSTKLTFVYLKKNTIFQKKGRPQGNIDKTDLRLFSKNTIENKNHPVIWREKYEIL